jgi:shikimate dehydrogenase
VGLDNNDQIGLDFSKVGKNKLFYDVIYNPNQTNFLKTAKQLGNKFENGKLMFIFQALLSFKLWHNLEPEVNDKIMKLLDS